MRKVVLIYLEMIETENDKEKFEQLYYKYRHLMYQLAYNITDNSNDAEDVVHEVFIYLIENMGKVGPVTSTRTRSFISIITEHKAIDLVRTRHPTIELERVEYDLATYLPNDNDLLQAMTELPQQYQDILLLRYHNGYSVREISKMLNISLSAVRKSIWRAKQALKEKLSRR